MSNILFKRNIKVVMAVLLLTMVFVGLSVNMVEATEPVVDVLERSYEQMTENRFWEIRRELHRIHHHLEFVPYMVFATIGIFLVQVGFLIIKIKEYKMKKQKTSLKETQMN